MIDKYKIMAWMNLAFNIIIVLSIAITPTPKTTIGKGCIYFLIAFLTYDSIDLFIDAYYYDD